MTAFLVRFKKSINSRHYLLIGAAIALRLLFMPITAHGDLLFIHRFPYFLSYHAIWDIYGYFGTHHLSDGYIYYQPLLYYLVAFFQWVLKPINPSFSLLMDQAHQLGLSSMADYFNGFVLQDRLRWVFMMKLPYLLADTLCVALILRLEKCLQIEDSLLFSWIFHPVLFFSTYIFGQYRILSSTLIFGFFVALVNRKNMLAGILMGLVCLMENYGFYILPVIFFMAGNSMKSKISFLLPGVLTFLAVYSPLYFSSHGLVRYAYFSPLIMSVAQANILNSDSLVLTALCKIVQFIVYSTVLIWLFRYRAFIGQLNDQERILLTSRLCAILLLGLYATSRIAIHYFMWVLPFLLISEYRSVSRRTDRFVGVLIVLLLFIFSLRIRPICMGLFCVLDPAYFSSLPSLPEWMRFQGVPWNIVIFFSRIIFSTLCLCFAAQIYIRKIKPLLSETK